MKRFLLTSLLALCLLCPSAKAEHYSNATAQGVALLQASNGRCAHYGGNRGYEGVGFSSVSADQAIRNCCYYGKLIPKEIGVARGARGWYACVRY